MIDPQTKKINYTDVHSLQFEGIDHKDYPDYVDAFISEGYYKDRPLTDDELDMLNDDHYFVYERLMEHLH